MLTAVFLGAAAEAASPGSLSVMSHVGEPFHGEIALVKWSPQELDGFGARLASADSHRQAALQYSPALQSLHFRLAKRRGGQPYIRVTSAQPFAEPVAELLVDFAWSTGTSSYAYTALIDPIGEKVARTFPAHLIASNTVVAPSTKAASLHTKSGSSDARGPAAQNGLAEQVRLKEEQAVAQKQKLAAAQERISELQQTVDDQKKLLALAAAANLADAAQAAKANGAGPDAPVGVTRAAHTPAAAAPAAPARVEPKAPQTPRSLVDEIAGAFGEPLYLGVAGLLLIGAFVAVRVSRQRKERSYGAGNALAPA